MKRVSIVVVVLILLSYTSCNEHKKKKKEVIKYKVTNPIRQDTIVDRDYVCQIHAIRHIELRALEKGYLQKIMVDEGQFVKKGQMMFKIMPNLYKAELQKAKAEANLTKIEYMNTKKLSDNNIVSSNELAMAKAKYEKAKAEVLMAETHLGFTNIKAPFDGIMDHFYAREGSLLNEDDLLTTLSDNSQMWVYFNVPEAEYLNYKMHQNDNKGLKVKLRMANDEIYPHIGEVKTIEADFNNETGNIAFRATFDNPDKLLRHGETGNVIIGEKLKNVLLIPQKVTFQVLDKTYIYVVDKDDVVRAKHLEIGAELANIFEVKEGLSEDDKILLEGIRKVRDGEKIEYEELNSKEVLSHLELYAE